MSLDGPGFHVDVDTLDGTARAITQSVGDQNGFTLRKLCGESALYGHSGLHDALNDFCLRWSGGLDTLTQDAGIIGDTLTHVAQVYRGVDEAAARTLTADPGLGAVGG